MKITKNKKGIYTTRLRIKVNGEWKEKRLSDKSERNLVYKASKLLKEAELGEINLKNWSLKEFTDVFIDTYIQNNLSKSTVNLYKNTLADALDFFGNVKLSSIDQLQYQQFLNHLGKHLARNTVDTRHKKMRAFFNKAIELEYIKRNPTRKATVTGADVAFNKIQYLEDYEVDKLIQLLVESYSVSRGVIMLALQTGMRYGELVALMWSDISFEKKQLQVTKSWDHHDTKTFAPTKTHENRIIFLDTFTVNYLKKYRKWHLEYCFKNNISNKHALLFCATSDKPIDNNSCNKVLKKLHRNINPDNNQITLHKLRHTHTVQCLEAGLDIIYVSERLGHADTSTTQKYYTHLSKKIREVNEERLDSFFSR